MLAELHLPPVNLKVDPHAPKPLIWDQWRKKWVVLTPEEQVRQHFLHFLVHYHGFPASRIGVEKGVPGSERRFDALVYSVLGNPWLLMEFKAPSVKLNHDVFLQAAVYNYHFKVPYLIVSNGLEHFILQADAEKKEVSFLQEIPQQDQ